MRKLISAKKIEDVGISLKVLHRMVLDSAQTLNAYTYGAVVDENMAQKSLSFPLATKTIINYATTLDGAQSYSFNELAYLRTKDTFSYGIATTAPWGGTENSWSKVYYHYIPDSAVKSSSNWGKDCKINVLLDDGTASTITASSIKIAQVVSNSKGEPMFKMQVGDASSAGTYYYIYVPVLSMSYLSRSVEDNRKSCEIY